MEIHIHNRNVSAVFIMAVYILFAFSSDLSAQNLLYPESSAAAGTARSGTESAAVQQVSTEIPQLLSGVWQNRTRLLQFSDGNENNGNISGPYIVLKSFYGWYYDRVAEPANISAVRDRNAAAAPEAENIPVSFMPLLPSDEKNGAWEINMQYNKGKTSVPVPVARIGDGLYLDFCIKGSAYQEVEDANDSDSNILGFWRAAGNASGILASMPILAKEVFCYYITADYCYRLRYWRTDADYEMTQATFTDGTDTYSVDKFLRIGDMIYTCVMGKATAIRHVDIIEKLPDIVSSDDFRLCSFNTSPYLSYSSEQTDVLKQAAEANKRKKPLPLPPPSTLDFHYDEIDKLRQYTPGLR